MAARATSRLSLGFGCMDDVLDERVASVVKSVHVVFEGAHMLKSPSHEELDHADVICCHR